jgi:hypothetical protein
LIPALGASFYLTSYFLDDHNYDSTHYLMLVKDKIQEILTFFLIALV